MSKKINIEPVLIVEGKTDQAFISSFANADYILTNGFDIKKGDIDFLQAVIRKRNVLVITDSDEAGKTIRNRLNELIPSLLNEEIPIHFCNKNHKHGVAECDLENLKNVLNKFKTDGTRNQSISASDIASLFLNSEAREKIATHFHLGCCLNNKMLAKRLNMLGYCRDNVIDYLKECVYGN